MSTLNFLSSLSLGFLLTAQHGFNYSPRLSSVPLMPDSAPLVAQASSLPPISKVEYHFCGVILFGETCKKTEGAFFWGTVNQIKIFTVSGGGNSKYLQAFVKSKGCFGHYGKPQTEAWYPISPTANPVKGQTPTASIVSSKLLSEAEKRKLIAVWNTSGLALHNTPCKPISL